MKLTMSDVERDALVVLEQGELSQGDAAERLGCAVRRLRRRLGRYDAQGAAGLVHRSRGRASSRRLPEAIRRRAVEALRERYSDFGPTLTSEKLAEHHGLQVSRETLRGWMTADDLWEPRTRKAKHRQWRERRACFGELVQIDTSEHDWFEGRGEPPSLITLIDDATGLQFMRFFDTDSTQTNMTLMREYITAHGRPMAFYGDKASHFRVNRATTVEEDLEGLAPQTQIERALAELDM